MDPQQMARDNGRDAMLSQLAPYIKPLLDSFKPLIDQPVIRMPYSLPLATSQVIGAGVTNFPLGQVNFSNAFEWPFEIQYVKFSNDPAHTFRDWRLSVMDLTFNQPWMKSSAMVSTLIDDNTGAWELKFPWIVRPKGGGLIPFIDNLDTVNPITVDIDFVGAFLIPR